MNAREMYNLLNDTIENALKNAGDNGIKSLDIARAIGSLYYTCCRVGGLEVNNAMHVITECWNGMDVNCIGCNQKTLGKIKFFYPQEKENNEG